MIARYCSDIRSLQNSPYGIHVISAYTDGRNNRCMQNVPTLRGSTSQNSQIFN